MLFIIPAASRPRLNNRFQIHNSDGHGLLAHTFAKAVDQGRHYIKPVARARDGELMGKEVCPVIGQSTLA